MVTLLVVPAAVSSRIAQASSVDDLREIASNLKAGYSGATTPQGVALGAVGLFEVGVRLLEVVGESSRLHKAITNCVLVAFDKEVQSSGLAEVKAAGGDAKRIRFGQPGHEWRPISDAQLGAAFLVVRAETERLLSTASGNTAIKAQAISKAVRDELFSLWSVDTRLVLGDDFADDDGEFDAD